MTTPHLSPVSMGEGSSLLGSVFAKLEHITTHGVSLCPAGSRPQIQLHAQGSGVGKRRKPHSMQVLLLL